MDRRKSIKALVVGTFSTGVLIDACKPADNKEAQQGHEHNHAATGDKKADPYNEAIAKKSVFQ